MFLNRLPTTSANDSDNALLPPIETEPNYLIPFNSSIIQSYSMLQPMAVIICHLQPPKETAQDIILST